MGAVEKGRHPVRTGGESTRVEIEIETGPRPRLNWSVQKRGTGWKFAIARQKIDLAHSQDLCVRDWWRDKFSQYRIILIEFAQIWLIYSVAAASFLLLILYPLSHLTTILFPWNKNRTQRMLMLKRWSRVHVIVVLANPIAWECVWWIGNSWKVKSISSIAY